jgi:hypothetical protein
LLLWDVCEALGLFDDQIEQILGADLKQEILAYLDAPVKLSVEGLPVVA